MEKREEECMVCGNPIIDFDFYGEDKDCCCEECARAKYIGSRIQMIDETLDIISQRIGEK